MTVMAFTSLRRRSRRPIAGELRRSGPDDSLFEQFGHVRWPVLSGYLLGCYQVSLDARVGVRRKEAGTSSWHTAGAKTKTKNEGIRWFVCHPPQRGVA